ncbi:MAG: efflux RND transporter periplasmic adaptor subunit [Sulfuriflexus sp.]|nr:efflux RND transporter periplasmic adaptor subunit [Sulfuriflexus sp.]
MAIITEVLPIKFIIHIGIITALSLGLIGCSDDIGNKGNKRPTRPAQLVELATVNIEPIQHQSQRTGTLKARKTIRIFNQEEGSLTSLPFYEGDIIKKGDILLQIDDKLLRAQFDKAKATLKQAQQDLKRLQKLRKKRLVAEDEVNRARTALNVAEAEQRLLATRLGYTSLAAPINGTVSERLAEPGDVAPRHTHLLTLIDTETLITEVAVSGLLIPVLSIGDTVDVQIDALPGQTFQGSILRIHPTLNASTRNGIVEIILEPAPKGARPGQFCRVNLLSSATNRKLIPFSALRQDNDGSYVYIINDKNMAARKHVATGLRFDDRIEIISGLEQGQRVITKGFLGLKDGKKIRTTDSSQQKP